MIPWNKGQMMSDELRKKLSDAHKGYVWSEESKRKLSKSTSGKNNPMFGREISTEHRRKLVDSHTGYVMPEEQKRKISESIKNYKKTPEHRLNISKSKMGEKYYTWKEGRSELKKVIKKCFKYRQWRSDVLSRDNFTCQLCPRVGGPLEIDHIKSFASILDEFRVVTFDMAVGCDALWDINNGRTLCKPCHLKTDTYGGRPRR